MTDRTPDRLVPGAKVRRKFDRRAVFFGISAVVAILLLPLCPPELRFVGWILGAVYVVLALVSWADFHSRRRHHR